MNQSREKRRRAQRAGRWAERLYLLWLRLSGHRVLARNWRSPAGEIDLIARRGRLLRFIEVKHRPDAETAAWALTPRQRDRIARAAALFVAHHPALDACDIRFDVVLMVPWRRPRVIRQAWT